MLSFSIFDVDFPSQFLNDITSLIKGVSNICRLYSSILLCEECGLLAMQLLHLLPMTTAVYLTGLHVLGQVMS